MFRWILYNYKLTSFAIFTSAFFGVSLISSAVIYLIFTFWLSPSPKDEPESQRKIKSEPQEPDTKTFNPFSISDLSDTARAFPNRGRQNRLELSGPAETRTIKNESEGYLEETTGIQPLAAEADDEDEGYAGSSTWRDSGIGTGIEEDRRGVPRRRKSSWGT